MSDETKVRARDPRPRIRTIKPEAWQDEKVGRLSHGARLLFVVLITLADDEGRFRNLPSLILGHGFPYDDEVTPRKLAGWMRELIATELVHVYVVDDLEYGCLPKWHRHQNISRRRDSILPGPSMNGHREVQV